jgi:hypothetical protein
MEADEFLRRFLLHVLPSGFVRIRYFGLLANRHRTLLLNLCREYLQLRLLRKVTTSVANLCQHCRSGIMRIVEVLSAVRLSAFFPDAPHRRTLHD